MAGWWLEASEPLPDLTTELTICAIVYPFSFADSAVKSARRAAFAQLLQS